MPILKTQRGFTLVELLIVIALIAILSVAVLATINPIEQTNKARDAQFKNDAAEVLSAYERYYASMSSYPWGVPTDIGATSFMSNDANFGVIGAGVGSTGVLVSTSELKSSFAAKEPFKATASLVNQLVVYNNGSDSNYVCFVPMAKANRAKFGELRCVNNITLVEPGQAGCDSIAEDSPLWNTSGTGGVSSYLNSGHAQFMCVPDTGVTVIATPTP